MHVRSFGTASRLHRHSFAIKIVLCTHVLSRSGCALSTCLPRTLLLSNLLESHACHGPRSRIKASFVSRANFKTAGRKEKEEKHATLTGLCPRVSVNFKSQGVRSQPLTGRSGNPEFDASRYPSTKCLRGRCMMI